MVHSQIEWLALNGSALFEGTIIEKHGTKIVSNADLSLETLPDIAGNQGQYSRERNASSAIETPRYWTIVSKYAEDKTCQVRQKWKLIRKYGASIAVPDGMPLEAPALEEFLISRLNPPANSQGRSE